MKSQNVSLLCVLCLCCSALLLLPTLTTSLNLSSKSQGIRFVSSSPSLSSSSSSYPSSRLNRTSKSNQRIDPRSTLSCHRREYTFKAIQTDSMGRSCYQYITAMTCWGRCDSGEIGDWEFPFKKSFHPMCSHGRKQTRRIRLKYCDPGAEESLRMFKYVEATTCVCRTCHSTETSCEGLPFYASRSL